MVNDEVKIELLNEISKKIILLRNLIDDINSYGFLNPSMASDLLDEGLIDTLSEINALKSDITKILDNEIKNLINQMEEL